MYKKIVTLFGVLAILFGCASAQSDAVAASITLDIYASSSKWWIALDPLGDGNATTAVDLQETGDATWQNMPGNPSWGFYALTSTGGSGFNMPISVRLTSNSGEQLVLSNVITSIAGGMIDTDQQFSSDNNGHQTGAPPTQAATQKPSTPAPTQKPATPAPTKKPAATPPPTHAPTKKPASSGSSSSGSNTDLCAVTPTSQEPLKILVPLYEDPDANWDALIAAAATGVPIIAIINPDDGPVSSGPDSSYTSYMAKFAAAGITMVGYVHTLYGARALATVEADVATYASKYKGLAGIFVDEASPDASELSYYTSLYNSIQAHSGFTNVIVNPGEVPDQGYQSASTNIMIFENPFSTWKQNSMPSWVTCAPSAAQKAGYKYKFSGVAYGTSQANMPTAVADFNDAGIGMVYVAESSNVCCVYNELTPYFSALASTVNALN